MNLSLLPGNEPLKRQLSGQVAARGLSHAYILAGPSGSGRHTLARLLAAAFLCEGDGEKPCLTCLPCRKVMKDIHPDVYRIGDDGKDIAVAQIRALRNDAYIRPNEGKAKVYLLEEAQNMNASAQNALLKLLEEGPGYAAFLLLTDNAGALLPTVRSRCEVLGLRAGLEPGPTEGTQAEQMVKLLTGGNELALMEFAISLEKWERGDLEVLFAEARLLLRDKLVDRPEDTLSKRNLLGLVDTLEKLRRACAFNAGTGHLAGWMCAEIGGAYL